MSQRIEAYVNGEWSQVYFMSNGQISTINNISEQIRIEDVLLRVVEHLTFIELMERINTLEDMLFKSIACGIVLDGVQEEIRQLYDDLENKKYV